MFPFGTNHLPTLGGFWLWHTFSWWHIVFLITAIIGYQSQVPLTVTQKLADPWNFWLKLQWVSSGCIQEVFGGRNTSNWTLHSNSVLHPHMRIGFSRALLRLNEHQDEHLFISSYLGPRHKYRCMLLWTSTCSEGWQCTIEFWEGLTMSPQVIFTFKKPEIS